MEHYFAQKRWYLTELGACIMLPAWKQFTKLLELWQMCVLHHFEKNARLFSEPRPTLGSQHAQARIPWPINMYYDPPQRPTLYVGSQGSHTTLAF